MKILIVGAGIGGLTLASFCLSAGHTVNIIDSRKRWTTDGYILLLWSNGLHVLDSLGIGKQVRRIAKPISAFMEYDREGSLIRRHSLASIKRHHESPRIIRRSDLHSLLRNLVPRSRVRLGVTIRALRQAKDSVDVTFTDGSQGQFDLVVGADGDHSIVRRKIFPKTKLHPLGFTGWWFWVPPVIQFPHDVINIHAGDKFLGLFPHGDRHHLCGYFVAKGRIKDSSDRRHQLRRLFKEMGAGVPTILQHLPPSEQIFYHEVTQLHLLRWHKGRVVLLGDAAHAISPFPTMGASLALEDAQVLSRCLSSKNTVSSALRQYERLRKPRVAVMQTQYTLERLLLRLRSYLSAKV